MEANNPVENVYGSAPPTVAMAPGTVGAAGNSLPHENRMPFLTINYCIALQGVFPSRN
jgi:microcystin-dependent protein